MQQLRAGEGRPELWAERQQMRLRAEVDQGIKQLRNGKPFLMR